MKNTKTKTQRNNQQIWRNTKEQQIWTTNQKSQIRNTYTNPDLPNPRAVEAAVVKLHCVLLHRVLLWVPWASCSFVGSCSLSLFFVVRPFLNSSSSDCSSVLRRQIVGSSLGLFFVVRLLVSSIQLFKYQNRVLETRFNKLKLESLRLKIYVSFSVQLIQPNTLKASLWDSSFNIDLEFLKLEMLVCLYVSNAY